MSDFQWELLGSAYLLAVACYFGIINESYLVKGCTLRLAHKLNLKSRMSSTDTIPFFKTNEFWGTFSTAFAAIFLAVGFGVNGHFNLAKWLFVSAFPFAMAALWCVLGRLKFGLKFLLSVLTSFLLAVVFYESYTAMYRLQHPSAISLVPPKTGNAPTVIPSTPPKPLPVPSEPEAKMPSVKAPNTPLSTIEIPEVALRFVYPKSPVLMVKNPSDTLARDIKWAVLLWNMDLPDRNDPLPIPSSIIDWIKPYDELGPTGILDTPLVAPLLHPGNRLFGSAGVDCSRCSKGKTYIVYIVLDQGGWYSELSTIHPGKLLVPRDLSKESREAYFQMLEAAVSTSARIPIGDWP